MNEKEKVVFLLDVKKVLDKHNLRYWLGFGTLLGALRNKGLIEGDNDVDLLFWKDKKELNKLIGMCENLSKKYRIHYFWEKDVIYIYKGDLTISLHFLKHNQEKAWFYYFHAKNLMEKSLVLFYWSLIAAKGNKKKRKLIINTVSRFVNPSLIKMVIFTAYFMPFKNKILNYINKHVTKTRWEIPTRFLKRFKKIRLYGSEFNVPQNAEGLVKYMYGPNWRKPDPDWTREKNPAFIGNFKIK